MTRRGPGLGVDLADPANFAGGIPHGLFASARSTPGLIWNDDGPHGLGFWSVTRHAELVAVSRDHSTFSSERGHIQIYDIDDDVRDARASMIDLDPPVHTSLRRLVSSAFTPRHVRRYSAAIDLRIADRLDAFVENGGGDWAEEVANPVPIAVICDILGVPEADHGYMVELTDHLVEGTSAAPLDPAAYGNDRPLRELPFNSPAAHGLDAYARDIRRRRIDRPVDDLLSRLSVAELDGRRLTETEFARFFQLMIFAGNETTRSAMSHMAALHIDHPAEFASLESPNASTATGFDETGSIDTASIDTAVEEIVRYASPILYFRRTATRATTLAGTTVAEGDKVVMWYASANFDDDVFDDPLRFDIGRTSRAAHVGFGGGGVHHCLGAPLARLELGSLLRHMARRRVRLTADGDRRYVESNFVNGIESLPVVVG